MLAAAPAATTGGSEVVKARWGADSNFPLPGERGPSSEYLEAPEYLELEADDVTRQDRRNV